jgi:hypothetical protein
VLRAEDLRDEVGELVGFYEIFEQFVVEEREDLVNDVECFGSELRVNGCLNNKEDPRQQTLRHHGYLMPVFRLDLMIPLFLLKLLAHQQPLFVWVIVLFLLELFLSEVSSDIPVRNDGAQEIDALHDQGEVLGIILLLLTLAVIGEERT